jgi:hypothetical protein
MISTAEFSYNPAHAPRNALGLFHRLERSQDALKVQVWQSRQLAIVRIDEYKRVAALPKVAGDVAKLCAFAKAHPGHIDSPLELFDGALA